MDRSFIEIILLAIGITVASLYALAYIRKILIPRLSEKYSAIGRIMCGHKYKLYSIWNHFEGQKLIFKCEKCGRTHSIVTTYDEQDGDKLFEFLKDNKMM